MKILEQLNPKNTVSFNRPIAHALGLNEALIYSSLISKQTYYSQRGMLDSEGWFYSTVADLQESTTLTKRQQSAAIKSLISAGLVECRICGMPARRYFRVLDEEELLEGLLEQGEAVMEELNPIAQKQVGNVTPCGDKNAPQEVTKGDDKPEQNVTDIYNPNIKKSEVVNPDPSIHHCADMNEENDKRSDYLEIIRDNIGFEGFADSQKAAELVEIMVDVICSNKDHVRVNGEDIPHEVVKSRFLKLGPEHISYVLAALNKNTSAVRNIRSYLITALYNSYATIDSYYTALVNHDMYGNRQY
ncbi:MAG: DUF6017 domain-containing protein [Oscillospiraceae bacterium]